MKFWIRTLIIVLIVITVLSMILSACGPIDNGNENGKEKDKSDNPHKITICHKTGSAKNPFVEITIADDAAKDGHAMHEDDIIPAPEGGCPAE